MSATEALAPPLTAAQATPTEPAVAPDACAVRAAQASGPQPPAPSGAGRATPRNPSLALRLACNALFWLTVLLPTTASGLYFALFASDIYVSDSKFVVRMPQRQQGPSLVGALMQGSGFLRSQDDAFTVHEYMLSRDALQALDGQLSLRKTFSAPGVDALSRFPALWMQDNFESLFRYYGQRVSVSFDSATSITTLRVTAFAASDAHAINARLLELGEALVNRINDRGRADLIRYAEAEVRQTEARAKDAAALLGGFRNARAVFDPERESALQLQSASRLQEELTAARGQLAQVLAAAPQNPQIALLRVRVKELEAEVAAAGARVMGGRGSLTDKAGEYERLVLERSVADRQLASALVALETARNEARRQQLYLARIVQPNLPDDAVEPRRLRNVVATLLMGLLAFGVSTLLLSAVREHRH